MHSHRVEPRKVCPKDVACTSKEIHADYKKSHLGFTARYEETKCIVIELIPACNRPIFGDFGRKSRKVAKDGQINPSGASCQVPGHGEPPCFHSPTETALCSKPSDTLLICVNVRREIAMPRFSVNVFSNLKTTVPFDGYLVDQHHRAIRDFLV